MADAISPISTSTDSECQTVDVARMSVAGEIEQLFEDGEVRSPMSGSAKALDWDRPKSAVTNCAAQENTKRVPV
jgi:hypothetical protein